MIVKIMKGDETFRKLSRSDMLCTNEVFIYKNVIPCFKNYVKDCDISFDPDKWAPKIYYADSGIFPKLSEEKETILAMENLKPHGFRLGPRLNLNKKHVELMVNCIATFHSASYAMKINKEPKYQELVDGLVPFSFLNENGEENEVYKISYTYALERLFNYAEKTQSNDRKFLKDLMSIKDQYLHRPAILMETLMKTDEIFSIILHGDYNRNNVLFKFDSQSENDDPKEIRMIDFQEVRYATPAIDLTFFMYMNISMDLLPSIWDDLMKLYHETLFKSLTEILQCSYEDKRLISYNYENFIKHLNTHAFYGAMVATYFMPWMASPEDECKQMSELAETNMYDPELRRLTNICGGDFVSERMISIMKHASDKGFMNIFED